MRAFAVLFRGLPAVQEDKDRFHPVRSAFYLILLSFLQLYTVGQASNIQPHPKSSHRQFGLLRHFTCVCFKVEHVHRGGGARTQGGAEPHFHFIQLREENGQTDAFKVLDGLILSFSKEKTKPIR